MKTTEWTYEVQLRMFDTRMYSGEEGGNAQQVTGISWSLERSCVGSNGKTYSQAIVSSPKVFANEEEAMEDALKKLSILRCPLEEPLNHAIRNLLDIEVF